MRTASKRGDLDLLTDDMSGEFVIVDRDGSEFRVDLDERVVRTVGRAGAAAPFARRLDEDVELLELAVCRVGEPMVLVIDLNVPGVWFTRRTTEPVKRIVRLRRARLGT